MEDNKFQNWEKEIKKLVPTLNPKDAQRFEQLLEDAEGEVDLRVAKILLQFLDDSDEGAIHEQTRNLISLSDKYVVYAALAKNLSDVCRKSPEWARTIVGLEFEYGAPHLLCRVFKKSAQPQKDVLKEIVFDRNFQDSYPAARKFVKEISKFS